MRLRPIALGDTGMRYGLFSDPSETSLIGCDPPKDLPDASKKTMGLMNLNKTGLSYHWTLEMTHSPHPIGHIDVHPPAPHLISLKVREIAFGLVKEYRGQGVMTEALTACIDFILRSEDIYRLEASVAGHNTKSITLLEKLGFQFEGVQRKKWVWRGERHDMRAYSLLADEWRQPRSRH